jgi:hypothetical protein
MKQSPLLEFESSTFAIVPGEDQQTNPGIYGKAPLASLFAAIRRCLESAPGVGALRDEPP